MTIEIFHDIFKLLYSVYFVAERTHYFTSLFNLMGSVLKVIRLIQYEYD